MDENSETVVIYVSFLNLTLRLYPDRVAQIASLPAKEIKIPDEYSDFADVFLEEKSLVLPECIKLNEYTINPEYNKQPPYRLIYSLDPLELETLKTYIKTHLETRFTRYSKSSTGAPILFNKKPDGSLLLCVNY